jgi:hypothetical protein
MAHGIGLANGDAAFLKLDALKRSRCVVVQYAPEKPTTISVNRWFSVDLPICGVADIVFGFLRIYLI